MVYFEFGILNFDLGEMVVCIFYIFCGFILFVYICFIGFNLIFDYYIVFSLNLRVEIYNLNG